MDNTPFLCLLSLILKAIKPLRKVQVMLIRLEIIQLSVIKTIGHRNRSVFLKRTKEGF